MNTNVTDTDREILARTSDKRFLRQLGDALENGPRKDADSDMPWFGIESEWAKELGKRLRDISARLPDREVYMRIEEVS